MSNSNNQSSNHNSPSSFLEQAKQQAQNGLFGNKQKKMFYQFISDLVNNQFPIRFYFLLIIVQNLQILSYLTHSTLDYTSIGLPIFRQFASYINPEYYLRTVPITMNVLIPIGLVLVLIHFSTFVIAYLRHRKVCETLDLSNQTYKKSKLLIFVHWMAILMCTVLTIPIAFPSVVSIYCSNGDLYNRGHQCYKTFHMFLLLSSLVNLVWLVFIHLVFCLFYFNRNPFWSDIFSMSIPLWNIVKFLVKLIPSGYSYLDSTFQFIYLYVFGIGALYVIYIGFGRFLFPYQRYNKNVQRFTIYTETVTCIMGIIFLIQIFFVSEKDIVILFLHSLLFGIPLGKLVCKLIINQNQQILQKINSTQKQTCEQLEKYLVYIIYDIQKRQKTQDQQGIGLFKIVKYHNDKCQNIHCHCHIFIQQYNSDQKLRENIGLFYRVLIDIISKLTQQNKKAYSLTIFKSCIQFFRLKNTIKAAFALSKILCEKTSIFEDYLVICLLYQFNKLGEDNSNMERYRIFSIHLRQYQRQVIKMASYYKQYWLQLIQQNSSVQKLMKLLEEASNSKQVVEKTYTKLTEIFPTNIRTVQVYKQLQKQVLLNLGQFIKHQNLYKDNIQADNQEELLFYDPNNRIKFTSNQDLIVISSKITSESGNSVIKADILTGGCQIINITHNIDKMLGYFYKDLIGKNINRFLPKIYCKFHDDFIEAYLNTQNLKIKPKQLTIYPLNSQGHIIQTILTNKIMTSLEHGVIIISFIQCPKGNPQGDYLIIYDKNTGLIDSMSQKAAKMLLGGKSKNNSIYIPDHITDILPMWDISKETQIQSKYNSQKDLCQSVKNISLKQSDGPQGQKYVKVIKFELQFKSMMFSFNENQLTSELSQYIYGYQTLMENACQKQQSKIIQLSDIILKQKTGFQMQTEIKKEDKANELSYNNSQICQTAKPLLSFSPKNLKLQCQEDNLKQNSRQNSQYRLNENQINNKSIKPIKKQLKQNSNPQQYLKLISNYVKYSYAVIQVLLLLGLFTLVLYQFIIIGVRLDSFSTNIKIKQQIQDCQIDVVDLSNYLSQYLYGTANYSIYFSSQINPVYLKQSIISLQSQIDQLYSYLLQKQSESIITLSSFYLNVSYFNGKDSLTLKNKLVTDATYQFISYYLDILAGIDQKNTSFTPINLTSQYQNNILYIFKNSNEISEVYQGLNSDFTNFLMEFMSAGKQNIKLFLSLFLTILFLIVLIQTVFQGLVLSILEDIINVYRNIPVLDIQKFPNKCQHYIKYVCPQQKMPIISKAVKTIHDLGEYLKSQKDKQNGLALDEQKSFMIEQKVEYISFSQSQTTLIVFLSNLLYVIFFVGVTIIFASTQSSNIQTQTNIISQWDSLTEIRDKLSKIAYFSNEYISYGQQWNKDQIAQYKSQLIKNLVALDADITTTSSSILNSYQTNIYSLAQQFRYLVSNPININMERFFMNQQKTLNISAQLIDIYVYNMIHNTVANQNQSTIQNMQIFLIVQLLYLAFYSWFHLFKKYKKYIKKYEISIKMYETLGNRLQKIGIQNYRLNQLKK